MTERERDVRSIDVMAQQVLRVHRTVPGRPAIVEEIEHLRPRIAEVMLGAPI